MLNRLNSPGTLPRTFSSQRTALAVLIAAIGLAGCAGLPDERLANEAMKRGDTSMAESNYQALANMGFVDAKVGLADIEVQSGDPAKIALAEATYRAALDESPRAQARLGRLLATKPNPSEANKHEAEQLLKRAFGNNELNTLLPLALLYLQYPKSFPGVDAQTEISKWIAAGYPQAPLAQIVLWRMKETYDQHLDEIESMCLKALATQASSSDICYVELATVYQKKDQPDKQKALIERVRSGNKAGTIVPARVDGVARVISDQTLGKPDPKTAQSMLEDIAPAYPAAWVSLAQVLYDFPELGDVNKMMEYLKNGQAADQSRADLLMGKLYYEGKWVPQDPFQAEKYLAKAAPTQIAGHYYLGQIYRRGYLGHVYSQKAVDQLLIAARGGQNSADFALAQLFTGGRGTIPNTTNAYVFSELALNKGNPLADILAAEVNQSILPADREAATRLIAQERTMRGTYAGQTPEMQAVQDQALQEEGAK